MDFLKKFSLSDKSNLSSTYFDLNEEISEMFPESSDVLIKVEESFDSHLNLELCQVRKGIVQHLRYEILDEDDIGSRQTLWGNHGARRV
jgi:hypothetical protein